jgi:hypothetical protein
LTELDRIKLSGDAVTLGSPQRAAAMSDLSVGSGMM